jgi:pyridoxamine 5'-phosphate oxidase
MAETRMKKDTLEHVLAATWQMLTRGAAHFNDPFHQPVLATGRSDGCGVRTVILRHADQTERTLICYADVRSTKIAEIEQFGCAGWLFYHPRKKIQVRIHGSATVHADDPVAQAQWKRVKGFSRLSFCTDQPPGTLLERPSSGLSERLLKDLPKLMTGNAGRDHFAVIKGRVATMDWLQLRPSGNIRARFQWDTDLLDASWIVP